MLKLSAEQAEAIDMITQWAASGGDEFRLGGLAGTGKTTIVTTLPEILRGADIRFVAPTGKAASVLTRKLQPAYAATTIHQLMYKPVQYHCGFCEGGDDCHGNMSPQCGREKEDYQSANVCKLSFAYSPPDEPPDIVIVDEASMVGGSMYEHLKELGSQLLFVGDHGQLSPIDSAGSVMTESRLDLKLETIHRQAANSPILKLAMMARNGKKIAVGDYGNGDVQVLLGSQSNKFDADIGTMLICYTNGMRKRLNKIMRDGLGFGPGTDPVPGDRVVCLRNNYPQGIANGMLGTIVDCWQAGRFYRMRVAMDDSKLEYNGICLIDQFHELAPSKFMRGVDQWTFGYALTAHKAQGSEAEEVVIFQEDKMKFMRPMERRRWLYTAITRAKKKLTLYTPIFTGG